MILEDRLTCIHGKETELSSIFENGMWEIETRLENIDPSRVMKARFVLKSMADNAGNPKGKVRFVLQGFLRPGFVARNIGNTQLPFVENQQTDLVGHSV